LVCFAFLFTFLEGKKGGIQMKKLGALFTVVICGLFLIDLANSSFCSDLTVFGPKTYVRGTGKPQVFIDTFSVSKSGDNFELVVQNGKNGKNRASAALIWINGQQILGPSDFNQQVDVITKSISLKENNEIKVELRSNPGSFIVVNIFGKAQNTPPVANAGPDQTVPLGTQVSLDGSKSADADGDALTYKWSMVSKPAGSAAALSDPSAVNPSFVVDKPGTYVAQLIVNDGKVDSLPDTVTISTANSKPVAEAGPDQTLFVTQTATLDGSKSMDADGDALTYNNHE
jgi:hypothetical protein